MNCEGAADVFLADDGDFSLVGVDHALNDGQAQSRADGQATMAFNTAVSVENVG
jgi:hypothetical protein